MNVPGWRALGITWVALIAVLGGGGLWLDRLGPPNAGPAVDAREEVAGLAAPEGRAGAAERGARQPPTPGLGPSLRPPVITPDAPATGQASTRARTDAALTAPAGTGTAPEAEAAAAGTPSPRSVSGLDPALSEASRHGPLPRLSQDNRTSIRTYARAFDRRDPRPRIAIILGDIGINAVQSEEALRRLPADVTLAISPYGFGLQGWVDRARERGMEYLLALPLEPAGFPLNDPGDRALLTGLSINDNLERLNWLLSRIQGYVGVVGAVGGMRGERFAQAPEAFEALQIALYGRGLLYIDPRPGTRNPPRVWGRAVEVIIDEPATRGEIERRLASLETIARERGSVLGLASGPTPVVVDRITAWAATLEGKGLVLAPVSNLIRRPEAAVDPARTQ